MFFREFHHWKDSHVEMDKVKIAYIYESPSLFDLEGNLVFDAIPYNNFKFCVIEVE